MRKLFAIITIFTLSIVSLGKEYKRIASGSPAVSEILYELGLKDNIIAMDKNSDVKGLENIPKVSFYNISMEEMLELKADLVIFSTFNKAEKNSFVTLMEKNGTDVIYLPDITSIQDIYTSIRVIGEQTERVPEGEKVIAKIKEDIKNITDKSEKIEKRKKVYFEISPYPNMYTFGKGVFMNEMLEKAGVENIFKDQKGWFIPNLEAIAVKNPDLIFTSTYQLDNPIKELEQRENWRIIKAIKEKKIYHIEKEVVRPSVKVAEMIREIFEISYPELKD